VSIPPHDHEVELKLPQLDTQCDDPHSARTAIEKSKKASGREWEREVTAQRKRRAWVSSPCPEPQIPTLSKPLFLLTWQIKPLWEMLSHEVTFTPGPTSHRTCSHTGFWGFLKNKVLCKRQVRRDHMDYGCSKSLSYTHHIPNPDQIYGTQIPFTHSCILQMTVFIHCLSWPHLGSGQLSRLWPLKGCHTWGALALVFSLW
jgi:hypothetical protein